MAGLTGVPDLVSMSRLGRRQGELKAALDRARTETTTGRTADRFDGGDARRLLALDASIAAAEARAPLIGLARSRAGAMQTALETAQAAAPREFATRLLGFVEAGDGASAARTARDAKTALGQVVAALNASVAGRAVFGGDGGDGPTLDGADAILADVRRALDRTLLPGDPGPPPAPPPSADAQLDHYFGVAASTVPAPPPDMTFDARIYGGGEGDAPPVELAEGDLLYYGVRADHADLKALMRHLAVAVATAEATDATDLGGAPGDDLEALRIERWRGAAMGLLTADDRMTDLRAELGAAEARIDDAETWTRAQREALELTRSGIEAVDPYEAATRLQQLELQLRALYEVTARTSQLSLLNFLR
jgi:flagellar hook-associated protein 3 FlgL